MGKSPPPRQPKQKARPYPAQGSGGQGPAHDSDEDEPTKLTEDFSRDEDTRQAPEEDDDEATQQLLSAAARPAQRGKARAAGPVARLDEDDPEDEDDEDVRIPGMHPWRAERSHQPLHRAAKEGTPPAPPAVPREAPPKSSEPSREPPRAERLPREPSVPSTRAGRASRPAVAPQEAPKSSAPAFPPAPKPDRPRSGVMGVLDNAQEPGVLFAEAAPGTPEVALSSPALVSAVHATVGRLGAVAGVAKVAAGRNDEGAAAVLITAQYGFTEASLRAVPAEVEGFPTLLVIPFDLLPLKRAAA